MDFLTTKGDTEGNYEVAKYLAGFGDEAMNFPDIARVSGLPSFGENADGKNQLKPAGFAPAATRDFTAPGAGKTPATDAKSGRRGLRIRR